MIGCCGTATLVLFRHLEHKFRLHKIAVFDLAWPYRGRGILSRTNFYPDGPPTFVGGPFRSACLHRRRLEGFMDTAEIVVRDVMATARNAIVQVL